MRSLKRCFARPVVLFCHRCQGGAAIGGEQMSFDALQHEVKTLLDFAKTACLSA
jgi:hypothetical protein